MSLIQDLSTGKALDIDVAEEERKKEKKRLQEMRERGEEPEIYKPRHHERMEIKLSPEEENHLREIYSVSIVHDFGDMYHLTDEERQEKNQLYEAFQTIQNVKTKYKRLDEFVINYRKVLKVLREVAKTNVVYDPEEFMTMVLDGTLIVYGIQFPKVNIPKKKRKEINWAEVTRYIMNDSLDPRDLLSERKDGISQYDVVENPEQAFEEMFGIKYEEFMKQNPEEEHNHSVDSTDLEAMYGHNITIPTTMREIGKDLSFNKSLISPLRDMILAAKKSSHMRSPYDEDDSTSVFYDMNGDIEAIRAMDEERDFFKKKKSGPPQFTGSFLKDKDVDRYLYRADEYIASHHKVSTVTGSTMTVREYEEEQLREYLEDNGWNIRKFYNIGKEEKEMKRRVKRENKRLQKIKDRMVESSNRRSKVKRVGFGVKVVEEDTNRVNSKKRKKSKKAKKKEKKLRKDYIFGSVADDYDAYEEAMRNMEEGY